MQNAVCGLAAWMSCALAAIVCSAPPALAQTLPGSGPARVQPAVEQWSIFELVLRGSTEGNPFDVQLSAKFTLGQRAIEARGFYDGQGVWRVRFMPPEPGVWTCQTSSDLPELSGRSGHVTCTKASTPGNHGPVVVRNTYHFAYADGTPFHPITTTLYGWVNQQSEALQEQTLASLRELPFNRIRMMVLPIAWSQDNVPRFFPFQQKEDQSWEFARFDPRFFQAIEKRLGQLRDMGIEAELILFHNRDGGRTGFDRMPESADDRYVRYVVARFSAYRNVWWSLANEFDAIRTKRDADWDRFFQIIQSEDPYGHLRSVHQMRRYYDFFKPWVTHLSVQSELGVTGFGRPVIYRQLSRKPVIFDEPKYEGDIPDGWGRLSGEEMVYRFWVATVGGTYAAHGETFASEPGVRWISRGGKLVGQSPQRIAFLKQILATAPAEGLTPIEPQEQTQGIAGQHGKYYLIYFGKSSPTEWTLQLPRGRARGGTRFRIDVLDTWNMTITPLDQVATIGEEPPLKITLPGKPYIALRIQRID